jgi:hypothetical protein
MSRVRVPIYRYLGANRASEASSKAINGEGGILPFTLMSRGRAEGENQEHQSNPWQKIVSPPDDDFEKETGHPAWIRKYLDLADLMMRRVQQRLEQTPFRRRPRHRDAA